MKNKTLLFALFGCIAFLGVAFSAPLSQNTFAQNNNNSSIADVKPKEFNGEVLKIEGQKITADENGTVREFTIPQNIKVTKNTLNSSLDEVKPKDAIKITFNQNDQILSVDTTASEVFDYSKFIIPILILLAAIIALLYYFMRKSKQGQIKTVNTNL